MTNKAEIFGTDIEYERVCADSRNIRNGDLFVALTGENSDGHDFVKSAFDNGAAVAVVEKIPNDLGNYAETKKIIKVSSTRQALRELAQHNVNSAAAIYIGVTGSVGKTTTKSLIWHLLKKFFGEEVYSSEKNFNSQIGLPICAASMPRDTKLGIFEMGMSEKGELQKLTQIVQPDISVITEITATHLEFFNSIWDIAKAKSEIMDATREAVIIPADSAYTDFLKNKAKKLGLVCYTFGRSKSADIKLLSADYLGNKNADGTLSIKQTIQAEIFGKHIQYELPGCGDAIVSDSLAAILTALIALRTHDSMFKNSSDEEILSHLLDQLKSFNVVDGRGRIFIKNGVTIIDDSYNACPASVRNAIISMNKYCEISETSENSRRKILAIGDMKELGRDSRHLHANLAVTADKFGVDCVFACGELSKYLFDNLSENKKGSWCQNSEDLASEIKKFLRAGDVILVKGSHSMNMGKIIEAI